MMKLKYQASIRVAGLLLAGLLAVPQPAVAQDAIQAPASKQIGKSSTSDTDIVPSLIVLNAKSASLEGNTLTLEGVPPNTIIFADRPVRAAGHMLTAHIIEDWNVGKDNFSDDPPNATVSVFDETASTVMDAVVVLDSPKLDGDKLTFKVEVLEGDLQGAKGAAAVFIDIFGVRRRAFRRGAYYGAAVAAPVMAAPVVVAPPVCGAYPYPPCY